MPEIPRWSAVKAQIRMLEFTFVSTLNVNTDLIVESGRSTSWYSRCFNFPTAFFVRGSHAVRSGRALTSPWRGVTETTSDLRFGRLDEGTNLLPLTFESEKSSNFLVSIGGVRSVAGKPCNFFCKWSKKAVNVLVNTDYVSTPIRVLQCPQGLVFPP